MKIKIATFLLIITSFSTVSAQRMIINLFENQDSAAIERNRLDKKNAEIIGTPYVIEKFMPADIEGAGELVLVRYNSQTDEVEVEYNDKVLTLPKKPEYNKIAVRNGQNILLLNYTDVRNANVYGYLYESFVGKKTSLYVKNRTVIVPEKQPQSSYDSYVPARFSRTDDEYYFTYNGAIVAFPDSKKGLTSLYPEKKKEIEDFLKTNKLKFKTEQDLIKIATFLDTL